MSPLLVAEQDATNQIAAAIDSVTHFHDFLADAEHAVDSDEGQDSGAAGQRWQPARC